MTSATVQLSTGPRLHYVEHGDPGAETVLFLHGWPDSWFTFSRLLPLLPAGMRAFAVDQRGFGDSERPREGYGISDLAADAVAFLDAMSVERATVVGHSFGSFVARRVAIAHPHRVSRLVLIGSGYSPSNEVTREVMGLVGDLADPVPIGFARDFQAGTAYRPLPEDFFERVVAESMKLPARLWRATMANLLAYDDEDGLRRITAPTLLLWGDRDALFSREDQRRLEATIPGARLTIYEETGHCPNWERPEQVAADLAAFMRQAASSART